MSQPLHCQQLGQGPPLLLIHGDFFDGATTWAGQLEDLARHHRLIVLDRRGRGRSPRDPAAPESARAEAGAVAPTYTIERDAADALEVADLAGVAAFHLLGQSYGGMVALEVARRAPERVLSLHMIEPPYLALLSDDPAVADLSERSRRAFGLAGVDPEGAVLAFAAMLAGPEAAERLRTRPVFDTMVREAAVLARVQHPADYPAERLAELRLAAAIRIYTGGRSHPGFHRVAERLSAHVPGARVVPFPDAGHDVQRSPGFNHALLSVTAPEP